MPITRQAGARWREAMAFEARATTSGYSITLDASPEAGGRHQGFLPMEMFLVGLAGCTGMDVISLLRKMRQEVTNYEVKVEAAVADEHPKVYTDIQVEHVVKGSNLSAELVGRAVEISATRYCPASAMLSKAARVTHTFRIVEE